MQRFEIMNEVREVKLKYNDLCDNLNVLQNEIDEKNRII